MHQYHMTYITIMHCTFKSTNQLPFPGPEIESLLVVAEDYLGVPFNANMMS